MSADDLAAVREALVDVMDTRRYSLAHAALDRLAARLRATEIGILPQEITDELARLQDKLQEAERERDEARQLLADERPCEQRLDEEVLEHIKTEDRAEAAEAREAALREALTPYVHQHDSAWRRANNAEELCQCQMCQRARAALAEKPGETG